VFLDSAAGERWESGGAAETLRTVFQWLAGGVSRTLQSGARRERFGGRGDGRLQQLGGRVSVHGAIRRLVVQRALLCRTRRPRSVTLGPSATAHSYDGANRNARVSHGATEKALER
jgi:hypothetical protein